MHWRQFIIDRKHENVLTAKAARNLKKIWWRRWTVCVENDKKLQQIEKILTFKKKKRNFGGWRAYCAARRSETVIGSRVANKRAVKILHETFQAWKIQLANQKFVKEFRNGSRKSRRKFVFAIWKSWVAKKRRVHQAIESTQKVLQLNPTLQTNVYFAIVRWKNLPVAMAFDAWRERTRKHLRKKIGNFLALRHLYIAKSKKFLQRWKLFVSVRRKKKLTRVVSVTNLRGNTCSLWMVLCNPF
jgi:hypothetical protein